MRIIMKARVKATGEIVRVKDCGSVFRDGALFHGYVDAEGNKYLPEELAFDVTDKDAIYNQGWQDGWDEAVKSEIPKIHPKLKGSDPDYWTKLEHQYAGMAMQGILTNPIGFESIRVRGTNIQIETALLASEFAHALVEKMKEERK